MDKIRITKEFTFEMAHALNHYDGPCAHLHGHSYHLSVTLIGEPDNEVSTNEGMVLDFGELKKVVAEEILSQFDHALALSQHDALVPLVKQSETKLVILPFQPTCENLTLDFVKRLKKHFNRAVKLHSIKLRETASAYAEWVASDNG